MDSSTPGFLVHHQRLEYSNSCPSSRWCHPTISSCVVPFFSCLQSFPASRSFPVSQFLPSVGQSVGVPASTSIPPMNIQGGIHLGLIESKFVWCKIEYEIAFTIAYLTNKSDHMNHSFNSSWTMNFQMFKLVLEKAEEPEIKLITSVGSSEKQESSIKNIYFCCIKYAKALIVWITTNCGKFWKRWEYQSTWPAS